jgi:hypothetical protein
LCLTIRVPRRKLRPLVENAYSDHRTDRVLERSTGDDLGRLVLAQVHVEPDDPILGDLGGECRDEMAGLRNRPVERAVYPRRPTWARLWSSTLSATVDFMLSDSGWSGSTTIAASYKDKVYFSQFNHEALSQDSVTTVDAHVKFVSPSDRWTINAWGKNLTDETIYMGTFIINSSRTNAGFLAPPWTVGVTVGYPF